MNDAIKWLIEHVDTVLGILTGVVTVASLIATLTPNDSDNVIVAKASKVVSWLALNIGRAKSE